MSKIPIPTSISGSEPPVHELKAQGWPLLPVETEIYILPDGQVIVADLPLELAPLLSSLGPTQLAEAVTPGAHHAGSSA